MARRKSVHKPEARKARPKIFLCDEHRRAMEQLYYLDEVELSTEAAEVAAPTEKNSGPMRASAPTERDGERETINGGEWGVCFGCMKTAWGRLYAFEPRKARYRSAGAGGGEREKARQGA